MPSLPPVLRELASLVRRLSRSGTGRTSSTNPAFECFQESQSSWLLCLHTAREPVVMHPRVWDHEVPLVMSQVIQATGWRIVHTWVVAPLDVHLHVCWSSCVCPLVDYTKSDLFPYLLIFFVRFTGGRLQDIVFVFPSVFTFPK